MNIVFAGTFGMAPKSTMRVRALPLAQALVRRGHEVTLVLPPWDDPLESGHVFESEGAHVVNVGLPPRIPGWWYLELTRRLVAATNRIRPDVVHVFKPKGFSGAVAQYFLARRALTARGPRVVVDTDDWEGRGGWNEVEAYPRWQKATFAFQERWLLRNADAVTAASRTLIDLARALRGRAEDIRYLPNGVVPRPAPAAEAVAALRGRLGLTETPVVLCYTRFVEYGPDRLVAALAPLAGLDPQPVVLLVGRGLHGEEQWFLTGARERARLSVVDAGWVDAEALPAYLGLGDVAMFPMEDSLINRAKCSAKLVDLLSAGAPVVASAVGQNREYIVDGESGVLVPPGEPELLGVAVAALLGDPARRARLAIAARQRMAGTYRWDDLAIDAEAAYS